MGRPKKQPAPEDPRIKEAVIAHTLAQIDKLVGILKTHGYTIEMTVQKPMSDEQIKELHN